MSDDVSVSAEELVGEHLRSRIELVPRPLWGRNLVGERVITKYGWSKLRRWALDRAGNSCEICGYSVEGGRNLICHELWSYDEERRVQTLVGVEIHCRDCDAVTHIGRTQVYGGRAAAIEALKHMASLNGWAPKRAIAYHREAMAEFRRRSELEWSQDLSWYQRWLADRTGKK